MSNYKGRKPTSFGAGQIVLVALLALVAALAMTIHANGEQTGQDAGEQIRVALIETKDWE